MTFEKRLKKITKWYLTSRLFGGTGADIHDFELFNYRYFIDHVRSKADLLKGLSDLSPFADDALGVAERMSNIDFSEFKISLVRERKLNKSGQSGSVMPHKFLPLLIPKRFMIAAMIAEEFKVPLGAALIRLMATEKEEEKGQIELWS